jgi:probable phosphoglycerate mutase
VVVNPSVPAPHQQRTRPPASGAARRGQRQRGRAGFLAAAVDPRGISGRHPPYPLRLRLRLATTYGAMLPTPAPSGGGGEEFTEVVVVRHGETSWNASRIVQVRRPPRLSCPDSSTSLLHFLIYAVPPQRASMTDCRRLSILAVLTACFDTSITLSRQSKHKKFDSCLVVISAPGECIPRLERFSLGWSNFSKQEKRCQTFCSKTAAIAPINYFSKF